MWNGADPAPSKQTKQTKKAPRQMRNVNPSWRQTWRQEGCDLPFLSSSEVQMLPSSTQSHDLCIRADSSPWQKKRLPKTKWMEMDGATATGTTTQGGRNTLFFRSGEEDKRTGCSQDKGGRIQSIAHSQPAKSGKEMGWIMSAGLGC